MPTIRLTGPHLHPQEFDVIGEDGDGFFVRHLGLAAQQEYRGASRDRLPVHHMGPPLQSPGLMKADVQAFVQLSAGEVQKIRVFVDLHAQEHAARNLGTRRGYCVHPHVSPVRGTDGTIIFVRFSCAGFVMEAYRGARLEPMDLTGIPLLGLEEIAQAYPEAAGWLRIPRIRESLGLSGPGPWPVILCGYFIRSFDRPEREVRSQKYAPVLGDRDFERAAYSAKGPQ